MVTIIYSDRFLEHQGGAWHPERPERLTAIVKALHTADWGHHLHWVEPTPIAHRDPLPWIQQCHDVEYIALVERLAARTGGAMLDPDTFINTYEVPLLAVNAWLDGIDRVVQSVRFAFVLARPPGHHAERDRGMGFCLFANAAIAAHYALTLPDIERVAILDWDVHHGNGTQHLVEANPAIAYCSLHQHPCYPGTGRAAEKGVHNNVLNIPLPPGSAIADYHQQFTTQVMPFLQAFVPDLLIVSAGYDANHVELLAGMSLFPADFGKLTEFILSLHCPILFGLEGGYDLEALPQSVLATLAPCIAVPAC